MRYLAIDYGKKRIGLAICDEAETIASPLTVIAGSKDALKKIIDLVDSEEVGAIVMGLPLNMDDSTGPQAKLVERFTEELEKLIDIPIHFQDERLSTFSAEEKISAAQFTTGRKKKRLDAIAAAEILQSFLEKKNTQ